MNIKSVLTLEDKTVTSFYKGIEDTEKEQTLKKTFSTREEAEKMFSACCLKFLDVYLEKPQGELSFIVKE